jgi:hypothetical protein
LESVICSHKEKYNFPDTWIGGFKKLAIKHYSNDKFECNCCGENQLGFLTIDHINKDGGKHKKEIHRQLYKWLFDNDFPKGFQVLCFNCNSGRNITEDKKCPHKLQLNFK